MRNQAIVRTWPTQSEPVPLEREIELLNTFEAFPAELGIRSWPAQFEPVLFETELLNTPAAVYCLDLPEAWSEQSDT